MQNKQWGSFFKFFAFLLIIQNGLYAEEVKNVNCNPKNYLHTEGANISKICWSKAYNKEVPLQTHSNETMANSYHDENNPVRQAQAYVILGKALLKDGKDQQALKTFKKALTLYKSKNYKHLQSLYNNIGVCLYMNGDLISSLHYGLLAEKTANANKDSTSLNVAIKNAIGKTYQKMHQYSQSLEYHKSAFAISKKYGDTALIQTSALNTVNALTNVGQYKEALILLKLYDTNTQLTEQYYTEIYRGLDNRSEWKAHLTKFESLAKQDNNPDYNEIINRFWAEYYLKTGQFKLCYLFLQKHRMNTLIAKNAAYSQVNELLWFKADSASGKWLSSIDHLERYKDLNYSIFSASKKKQDSLLAVEFESEKKDRDIVMQTKKVELMKKKSQLQQSKVEHSKNVNRVMMGGAITLALLLGVSYYGYRLKKQSNIKLVKQQEEIAAKNQSLNTLISKQKSLLTEKEWLLREIHHRVKNNLQIVMSLLETQSLYLKDPAAINAIVKSQSRVQSIALIHQKLYKSDNSSLVYMPEYINDLVEYLSDTFEAKKRIHFELDIEKINLDVVRVVPIGLILSELLTNSIKHAFPKGDDDKITVRFGFHDDANLSLTISDNGVGFPAGFEFTSVKSFGLIFVKRLIEENSGSIAITNGQGITFTIMFDKPEITNRH